jgi:undecaprenyl diphosphate synthase
MDGNRRFARSRRIETVEGHNLGFEALARVGSENKAAGWHSFMKLTLDPSRSSKYAIYPE